MIKTKKDSSEFVEGIFKDVAKDCGLDVEKVKEIHDDYWGIIYDVLADMNFPLINVIGLGRFKPTRYGIKNLYKRVKVLKRSGAREFMGYDIEEVGRHISEVFWDLYKTDINKFKL